MGKTPLQSVAGLHVLVTGAAQGMGLLFARQACLEGAARVVIWDIDAAKLDAAAEELRQLGGTVETHVVDLADQSQIQRYAATAVEGGGIDVLVNNAGVVDHACRVADMSAERMRRMLNTNVLGSMLCAREAVRRMSTRCGGE
ncbi:MAG: SDR family NAD(P)-dependent oxidoreductase, partial [Glutamicibacter sp.]